MGLGRSLEGRPDWILRRLSTGKNSLVEGASGHGQGDSFQSHMTWQNQTPEDRIFSDTGGHHGHFHFVSHISIRPAIHQGSPRQTHERPAGLTGNIPQSTDNNDPSTQHLFLVMQPPRSPEIRSLDYQHHHHCGIRPLSCLGNCRHDRAPRKSRSTVLGWHPYRF